METRANDHRPRSGTPQVNGARDPNHRTYRSHLNADVIEAVSSPKQTSFPLVPSVDEAPVPWDIRGSEFAEPPGRGRWKRQKSSSRSRRPAAWRARSKTRISRPSRRKSPTTSIVATTPARASSPIHARRPDDQATCNPDIYRRINALIREKCDIIINNSTGGGINGDMVRQAPNGYPEIIWEERLKGMEAGAEMCTLDPDHHHRDVRRPRNPDEHLAAALHAIATECMKARGIKPEWEVFSPTHLLQDVTPVSRPASTSKPYFINFVLDADRGFQGAMPYTPKVLQQMVDLMPEGAIFNVSAIGIAQLNAAVQSLLLGGHVRVGLEDNLYYSRGRLANNVELVERIVRIIRDLGMEPATPAEARKIIGLPRRVAASAAASALKLTGG